VFARLLDDLAQRNVTAACAELMDQAFAVVAPALDAPAASPAGG